MSHKTFLKLAATSVTVKLFMLINLGVSDRENADHIKEIKESLNALEGGRVVDF